MRSDPSDHQSRSGPDGVTIEQPDAGSIDAFAAAFDGEPGAGLEPYVRLVPPDGAEVASERSSQDPPATPQPGSRVPFDPEDIERREYRLLARALTNGDPGTDHLAAMTLVQLVKFLRAAGVSVPDFPDTGGIPDPGATRTDRVDHAQGVDPGPV